MRNASFFFLAVLAVLGTVAFGQNGKPRIITVEGFEDFKNESGWTFGRPPHLESTGGNPGVFLHAWDLDVPAPWVQTTKDSGPFIGNFRSRRVESVRVDLNLFWVEYSAVQRYLAVTLLSDNDTPAYPNDDWIAYCVGTELVPQVGEGWVHYEFPVPSQSNSLPSGWSIVAIGMNPPDNPDWNQVIMNVRQLGFHFGDPSRLYAFQRWEVGMDNACIVESKIPVEAGLSARVDAKPGG